MGRKGLLLLSCAIGVLTAGQASAQVNRAQAAADPRTATEAVPGRSAERARQAAKSGGYEVEELVVTAAEAISNLEDAPVAVTTFTAEQRNLTAVNTIDDLVNLTPGTTISANGINMRGVGRQTSETATLGSDPGVAYYVNGFYSVVAGVIGESTLYSESIQFQRGPQGTRFGRNAIAGTASLWARRPTKDFKGQAVAQYGDNGFWGLGINLSGPLNDRYGIRFGWQHFDTEKSVQRNIYPTKAGLAVENNYFEFQIEGQPTDNLHFWLRSTAFQYMSDPGYSAPPTYNTTASMGALVPNPTFRYTTLAPREPRQINVDTKGADRLTGNSVHIFNADYDLGPVKLYYVGGYARYKAKGYSDNDRAGRIGYTVCAPSTTVTCTGDTAPFPGLANGTFVSTRQVANYHNRNQYFTHEVRLQNEDTTKVDWAVGAFFLKSNYNERFFQSEPDEPLLDNPILSFNTFAPAAPNPDRAFYSQLNIRRTQSVGIFADAIYHLSDRIDLLAGVRESVESARATTQIRYIFFNPAFGRSLDVTPGFPSGAPGTNRVLFKLHNEELTGRLGVDFHPDGDTLLYAKYSRGFKAGGFNLGNVTVTTNNVTRPELLNAYEVGAKHTFSPSLRGDATLFYYDYHDMQIPVTGINPTTNGTFFQYTNFDKARIWGLELQGTWQPISALWLNANYTYLNAETTDFCCAVDLTRLDTSFTPPRPIPERLDGRRLPRTPEHKAGLAAAYTLDFTPGSLILGGIASYTAEQYLTPFERDLTKLPSFTLVSASATWRSANNQYDLVAQVTNLFDEQRVTGLEIAGNNASATGVLVSQTYAAPRFWQVQVRYRF